MIEAIVHNPVKVAVAIILISLFGVISIFTMPIQLTPEVQIPTLTIETMWPGASPQEVEREIVQEQEEQLQSVEGVRKMSSESMDSMGRVILEFPVGHDMSQALLMVNTRLSQVREYPEDADEPVIVTSNSSDSPIAWFILSPRTPKQAEIVAWQEQHPQLKDKMERVRKAHNPGLMLYRLREFAKEHPEAESLLPPPIDVTLEKKFTEDFIETRFERVDGVSNSNVFGGQEEEMQVIVDPQKLAARNLTIIDVRNALRGNQDVSGGDFWEGKRRYVVRTLGEKRSPEQVANSIITSRDNLRVLVSDVAEVKLGHKKPDGLVRRFGTSVIAVNVQRETGANVLDVMAGLQEAMADLNENLLRPRGMELAQVYDETEYIHSSISLVNENLLEGSILTFICLMLFLRSFRSSLVVFISIAVSVVGMFLLMNIMQRSLNVIMLAGIAFAVGMLVDNFIVVLENIFRHSQTGENMLESTVKGTREVWGAVLASTLANLAVFVPVLFVRDEAGQLFRDIALATASALALSLLVSLILVPMAASRILAHQGQKKREAEEHDLGDEPYDWNGSERAKPRTMSDQLGVVLSKILIPLDAFGNAFVKTVVSINAWLQQGVLRQVVTVLGMFTASIVLSYLMLPRVEYLPNGNRNLVIGIMLPPPGYNLDQLTQMGIEIESSLKGNWDVDPESPEANQLKYPPIGDFFYVARGRMLFMGIRSYDPLRSSELIPLMRSTGTSMPGTFIIAKQMSLFEQGLQGGRNVDIEITGPDIHKLIGIGGQVFGKVMEVIPGAQAMPKPSLDLSSPEMHVTPKWEQAADMGVNAADLGYTVDALVDGAYASDYYKGGDKIDLSILGTDKFTGRSQDLDGLSIATPNGQLVPLAAVANIRLSSGPEQVNRRERQRAITIGVSPPPEVPLEEAINLINTQIVQPLESAPDWDKNYQINFSGTADKLSSTWQSLKWNLLLALVITYLVMSALFESWLYPFIIILSVPLGAVGGFAGLWLLNRFVLQPLDVLTMLGFIILVGTVVNNPILIVEQALVHIREEDMNPERAILESVRTRIRPIFMTALIGLFGLLPLAISPGAGSELYRGLGSVLLGGLVVSTVFTLVFVPTIFHLTMQAKAGLDRLFRRRDRSNTPTSEPREIKPVGPLHLDSAVFELPPRGQVESI